MQQINKIVDEHKTINSYLDEITQIADSAEEEEYSNEVNVSALMHSFKKLCSLWDKHEKEEEKLFSELRSKKIFHWRLSSTLSIGLFNRRPSVLCTQERIGRQQKNELQGIPRCSNENECHASRNGESHFNQAAINGRLYNQLEILRKTIVITPKEMVSCPEPELYSVPICSPILDSQLNLFIR